MAAENEMVIIRDLITLEKFFTDAIRTLGGIDVFRTLSIGNEGIQEIGKLFTDTVLPNNVVCTFQVSETPLTDNSFGLTTATFACTVMVLKKMPGTAQTGAVKIEARNHTWKKMLRLIGLINLASEYYATNVTELEGEAYEVIFNIFQDRLLPVGQIANANVQGWLLDIDITIPVNNLLYE